MSMFSKSFSQSSPFSSSLPSSNPNGTGQPSFTTHTEREGVTTNIYHSINTMPAYRNWSFEELRCQDYTLGKKGKGMGGFGQSTVFGGATSVTAASTPVATNGFGGFGSNQTNGFGSQQSTAFGGQATGFGQSTVGGGSNMFGKSATGGFGGANPVNSGFGQTTTPTTPVNSFGSAAFGQQNTSVGAFGQPTTGATTPFGGAASAPSFGGSGYNQPSAVTTPFGGASTPFGTTTTTPPAFGQPASNVGAFGQPSTSSFGQPATTAGGFGQPPAPGGVGFGFGGQGATAKPGFGTPAPPAFGAPTSSFGTTGATGGFGQQLPTTTPQQFGGFGQTPSTQPTPAFGGSTPSTQFGMQPPAQQSAGAFGGIGFGAQPTTTPGTNMFGQPQQQQSISSTGAFGQQPSTTPSLFGQPPSTPGLGTAQTPSLFGGKTTNLFNQTSAATPSSTSLFGKQPSNTPSLFQTPAKPAFNTNFGGLGSTMSSTGGLKASIDRDAYGLKFTSVRKEKKHEEKPIPIPKTLPKPQKRLNLNLNKFGADEFKLNNVKQLNVASSLQTKPVTIEFQPITTTTDEQPMNSDYVCIPSFTELKQKKDLRNIHGFKVLRKGFGSVAFLEDVDLSEIALNELLGNVIQLERKVIIVYPDDTKKHSPGKGLNVKAKVCLLDCYPIDSTTKEPIKDSANEKYKIHVLKLQQMKNTQFVSFENGTWTFIVDHFSKYGLFDDDEDENVVVNVPQKRTTDALYYQSPAKRLHVTSKFNTSKSFTFDPRDLIKESLNSSALAGVSFTLHNLPALPPSPTLSSSVVSSPVKAIVNKTRDYSKSITKDVGKVLDLGLLNFKSFKPVIYGDKLVNVCGSVLTMKSIETSLDFDTLHLLLTDGLDVVMQRTDDHFLGLIRALFQMGEGEAISKLDSRKRNAKVSEWLVDVLQSCVNFDECVDDFDRLFYFVLTHQVKKAAELAVELKHFELALIITQIQDVRSGLVGIGIDCKEYLQMYVRVAKVDEKLLKVFKVLSGEVVGEFDDWRLLFAQFLWFRDCDSFDLKNIIVDFEEFRSNRGLIISDVCYSLLNYFAHATPLCFTNDPVVNFVAVLYLKDKIVDFGNVDSAVMNLHEAISMYDEQWHWSIFALNHLTSAVRRKMAIQNCLERNATLESHDFRLLSFNEEFVRDKLEVGENVIFKAKALKSGYEGKKMKEWELMQMTGDWKACSVLLKDWFGPVCALKGEKGREEWSEWISNGNAELLKDIDAYKQYMRLSGMRVEELHARELELLLEMVKQVEQENDLQKLAVEKMKRWAVDVLFVKKRPTLF